jgi:teichuronic acid biosynthesis glycosyltransferase TuaC
MSRPIKILWVHNFNVDIKNAGVFMFNSYDYIINNHQNICSIDLYKFDFSDSFFEIIKSIIRLRKLSHDYDISHAQFGSLCGLMALFSSSPIKVITLRGSDLNGWRKGVFQLHGLMQTIFSLISLLFYKNIITVSNRMACEVASFGFKVKPFVLPSAVDVDKFIPLNKLECRRHIGWSSTKKYFIHPVINSKNIVKRPNFIEELRNFLPVNVEIITIEGINHQDLSVFYSAADCVLLPSIYEGWPNVIKEALLCNTPFITTDISDLRDIANLTKNCKILPLNVKSWINSLEQFEPASENLRQYILYMSYQKSNKSLLDYYRRLISR